MPEPESLQYHPLSEASYFVRSRYNEREISTATAFFVRRQGQLFLITNWHVVSGRHSETCKCLSPHCAIPNNLLVRIHKQSEFLEFEEFVVWLTDEQDKPLWSEHPVHGHLVDVVAIRMHLPSHLRAVDISECIEPMNEDTSEAVADDVFVVGYPFSIVVAGTFPIWKRGTIASEPGVDICDLPKILIDTTTRDGMSGSPVVLIERRPMTLMRDSPMNPGRFELSRHRMKLVGVYSGRIGVEERETNAQLGIVWKGRVIDEILAAADRSEEKP